MIYHFKTTSMDTKHGTFRFAYFSRKYQETCEFYTDLLEFKTEYSWDRDDNDKGVVFNAGGGSIEVLQAPDNGVDLNAGLDYRSPQGAFMVIERWGIDQLYKTYKAKGLQFKQDLTNQSWGHKSFSVVDPNGVVLFFFQAAH